MTHQCPNRMTFLSFHWKHDGSHAARKRARLWGVKHRTLTWAVGICLVIMLVGCNNATIIRVINQGTDGNSEIWVCEGGSAQQCRGEQQDDLDPKGFQKRLQVVAPPTQCSHQRTAVMDVVIKAGKISRVRYECGLPDTPTGLPPSTAPSHPETETPRSN